MSRHRCGDLSNCRNQRSFRQLSSTICTFLSTWNYIPFICTCCFVIIPHSTRTSLWNVFWCTCIRNKGNQGCRRGQCSTWTSIFIAYCSSDIQSGNVRKLKCLLPNILSSRLRCNDLLVGKHKMTPSRDHVSKR
ncbi:hypothetical protein BDW22DRAFT_685715 [Trametopsis cervina]|nr:hypothetical protein BDW22DRAFT_685715 [Trametopsis cervina]